MAIGPIDYVSGFVPVQDDIIKSIGQGMQLGQAYSQIQLQKQQQQAALEAQQRYERDREAALANPTPQAFAALSVRYPQHREAFKQGWEQLSSAQQQGELKDMSTLSAALQSDRPDVALSQIDSRIAAMEGSGQDTSTLKFLREQVQTDPKRAYGSVLAVMSSIPGGDKILESLGRVGAERRADELQAPTVAKAQAEAQKSAVDAKYAEQNAVKDLEKKGWDIRAIQEDIGFKREANRIAAMNASLGRESNQLKREELGLKLQEARASLDDKIRAKAAEAESARSSMDNFLNTADRLLNVSLDKNSNRPTSTLRAATGAIDSRLPTLQTDVADLEALAETLGSQAFLSQIPSLKGTGSLSEREGDKLQAALTNLSLRQSPEQFISNVKEAQRLILKARSAVTKRYGVPETVPDTPAAQPTGSEVDELVRKYTGGR